MGKTIVYILLLAILGAGVYFFVFRDKNTTFNPAETGFTVMDTGSVYKIFLTRTSGEPLVLERKDEGWILNGKYPARIAAVNKVLQTVRNQEAKYPVPENAHNGVVRTMAGNSVKVELYAVDGSPIRKFYVGDAAHNYTGTHMLLEGAKRPYVVQVPGFDGFLTPIYSTDLDDWRSRSVFSLQPDDIARVSVTYPDEPAATFTVTTQPEITLQANPSVTGGYPVNKRRVTSYLGFFSEINCEGYLNGMPHLDSLIASVDRYCTISVTDRAQRTKQVDIYHMPINRRSKNQQTPLPQKYDPDRYYAILHATKDTAIVQHFTFEKLFRKGGEFYQPDSIAQIPGLPPHKQ